MKKAKKSIATTKRIIQFGNNFNAYAMFNSLDDEIMETEREIEKLDITEEQKELRRQMNELAWIMLLSPSIISNLIAEAVA